MSKPRSDYDVIIIGGGVNGLTAGAYLQKAGLSTAIFERRDESGTFSSTEEVLYPGVKLNMHASLLMPHYGPAYLDLELERFGLELLRPPGAKYAYFYPFLDGNAVLFSGRDAREKKLEEAFGGAVVVRERQKAIAEILAQNTTSLYSIDRTISRPRPEFVTADPDFWKPKEPAKKEPAKK